MGLYLQENFSVQETNNISCKDLKIILSGIKIGLLKSLIEIQITQ